jgi:Flp pilus assembly protein TadG
MSRLGSCLLHGAALARGLCARSRSTARAFRADGGDVTLIFALAIIPIFGAVAAAVDYSRGNSARTAMQAVLDATSLMISKEALDLQNGQVQKKAKTYFKSQFTRGDVRNLNLSFALVTNGPGASRRACRSPPTGPRSSRWSTP